MSSEKISGKEASHNNGISGPGLDNARITIENNNASVAEVTASLASLSGPTLYNNEKEQISDAIMRGQTITGPEFSRGRDIVSEQLNSIIDLGRGRILKIISASQDRLTLYAQAEEIGSIAGRPTKAEDKEAA